MAAFIALVLSLLVWLPVGEFSRLQVTSRVKFSMQNREKGYYLSLIVSLLTVTHLPSTLQAAMPVKKEKGVLAPQSHTAATAEVVWRGRVSIGLRLVALVFFVLFLLSAIADLERDQQNEVWSSE